MNEKLQCCPFHGCKDTAIIKEGGYAFVVSLKCGVRGAPYNLKLLGEEYAAEMAISDWNAREAQKNKT
jgi:hypothetical protein